MNLPWDQHLSGGGDVAGIVEQWLLGVHMTNPTSPEMFLEEAYAVLWLSLTTQVNNIMTTKSTLVSVVRLDIQARVAPQIAHLAYLIAKLAVWG